ncbi:hypothetical protein BJ741DRAFT_666994 [Chytriomyces cf. hyalinus JEL632]|nr:hypothetical protein BJ741DRAFT_666994 [Chytriomyces cf. hyalinus JEL632]
MDELSSVVKHIQVHPDTPLDIKNHLPNPLFDVSVYSKGRKMNCLGKSKSITDDPLLLPWSENLEVEDFLIQHVPDTCTRLTWSSSLVSAFSSAPSSLSAPSTALLIKNPSQVDIIRLKFCHFARKLATNWRPKSSPGKLSPHAIFMDSQSAHYRYLHVKTCGESSELRLHGQKGNRISIDCSSTICPSRIPEHPNSYIARAQPVTQQYLAQLTKFNFQGNTFINVNAL